MNLEQFFSFDDDILPLIKEKKRKTFRKKDVDPDLETIKNESNAHIVGQLSDDVLLFTWDGKNERWDPEAGYFLCRTSLVVDLLLILALCEKEVTFFCLYNLSTKKPSVLFDHDRKIDVVAASVNEERTLLAFTIIEFKSLLDSPAEETIGIYKSFIAEISPKNRVFSLVDEGPRYQQVQFLHGKYPLYGSSSRRESHMLFFHHSESIDLYHIPLARIDVGMIMSGQPQVENIVKGFVWAQLDRLNKRLYYVYPSNNSKDETAGVRLIFSAIQFCEKSPRVITVRMPCPFPVDSRMEDTADKFQYDRKALTNIIAERKVNMQVVSSPDGSFFLCYQHSPSKERRLSQDSILSNEEVNECTESETPPSILEYSVLMCHHGSVLKCKIPNIIPEDLVDSARLLFAMLNDCVAVILPGYVLHLLDCNAEHPPCHHLILQGPDSMELPPCDSKLSEFVWINTGAAALLHKEELHLFEPSVCKVFKLKFDNNYWTDCFLSTHCDSTRLALLHFSIIHIQDPEIISRIFSHLARDPANLECLDILKEYLIGSTYFQMNFQVDALVYKLLPFSNTEPFRGHLETNREGKKIARISYSSMKTSDIFAQNIKDEKRKEMEFWMSLKRNVSFTSSVERFSLKKVAVSDEPFVNIRTTEENGFTSIFRKLRRFPYVEPHMSGNGESFEEYVPEFLEYIKSDQASKLKEERKSMKVLESLTRYLHHYLPSEIPKLKIQSMATEYTKCQKKQSSYLLHLFWEALKYTEGTHPYEAPLNVRGSSRECALLMLLERYYIAAKELRFPFPTGFQAFFAYMGFRCLDSKLFIQYVTNGIFELESEFMYRLFQEVGNDDSYSPIISRLISSFEQPKAIHFLDKWNSPSVSRLLCQRYVSNLLTEDSVPFRSDSRDFLTQSQRFDEYEKTVSSLLSSTDDSSELQAVPFRPLVNVLTALEATVLPPNKTRDVKGSGSNQESRLNANLKFVAKHALQHTANEVDDSLGLVAF